ncbi:uncharacterized protein J3R85_005880 [Psidium guajava]|nr:uncharacterized protein J3R85_005880 [Psidium guajava]
MSTEPFNRPVKLVGGAFYDDLTTEGENQPKKGRSSGPKLVARGYGRTPMQFPGDTKVEVSFAGLEGKEEDVNSEVATAPMKVLLPWKSRQGMNPGKEQSGEVGEESKMASTWTSSQLSDDKKSTVHSDDKKSLKDEYRKACYADLLKKQQELEESAKKQLQPSDSDIADGHSDTSSSRQVGVKAKRDPEDDVWEVPPYAGNAIWRYKLVDFTIRANESDEDDDFVDWEEG